MARYILSVLVTVEAVNKIDAIQAVDEALRYEGIGDFEMTDPIPLAATPQGSEVNE